MLYVLEEKELYPSFHPNAKLDILIHDTDAQSFIKRYKILASVISCGRGFQKLIIHRLKHIYLFISFKRAMSLNMPCSCIVRDKEQRPFGMLRSKPLPAPTPDAAQISPQTSLAPVSKRFLGPSWTHSLPAALALLLCPAQAIGSVS